jgi:hypothetical protein
VGTYQKRLEQHLSRYRRDRLGVPHCGTFRHKGVDRPYGHTLPCELRWLNVPEPFRAEVRNHVVEHRIQLHRYFHHLNSSQAFALSLFYPYLLHAAPALSNALGAEPIAQWAFEDIPDPREGTNVDVVLRSESDAPIYCEVKLSESKFGTTRLDERHCRKIETTYRPRLAGKVDPVLLMPEEFCASYQILRNLWHVATNPEACVLFLLPRENESLCSELVRVLPMVGSELRSRTRVAYIEDILDALAAPAAAVDDLRWYAALLQAKYVLFPDA